MSATAMADDFGAEPWSSRFARFRRKTRAKFKSAWMATWSGLKYAGRLLRRGAYRVGTSTAVAVTWTLRFVTSAIAAAFSILGAAVLLVAGLVLGAVAWVLATIADYVDIYLFGGAVWLFYDRMIPWGVYKEGRQTERMLRAEHVSDLITTRIFGGESITEDYIPDEGDIIVVDVPTQAENGADLSALARKTLATIQDRANTAVAEAFESTSTAFPGADTTIVDGENPFSSGSMFAPRFEALVAMVKAEDEGTDIVEFDFSEFLDSRAELQGAFEFLSYTAATLQMRSYWRGRVECLDQWRKFDEEPRYITEHGKMWGLIHQQYRGKQREFSLKHLRAGYLDQIKDIEGVLATTT